MDAPAPPPVPPAPPVQRPLVAVAWMVASGVAFVGVTAVVKSLEGRVPAPQAAFLRFALGLLVMAPLLPQLPRLQLPAATWRMLGLRGFVHSFGVILWFYAMSRITIAEVTAMNYLTPVLVTLGAALFLGERLRLRRLLAIAAALAGTLVILRPGFRTLDPGHLAMLGVPVLLSCSYLIAKRTSDTVSATMIVALLSLLVTLCLIPFAVAVWEPVSWGDLARLMVVAACATGGHYAMTRAFREGPLSITQPVTFLQLVWAVSVGAILFAEPIDAFVVAGGLTILGAVTFIALREARLRHR